jgi:hypothetical protein
MPAKVKLILAIVALAAVIGHMLFLTIRIAQLQLHDRITVGMTREDVVNRLGMPQRTSRCGEQLDPPHVSGFVPSLANQNVVYTYYWRLEFVYVFFDKDDCVQAYYVCNP